MQLPDHARFVFLCFTNRCGSNYTAELLASGRRFPRAGENLNADTVIDHAKQNNFVSFQEYFSFLADHTMKHDIISIKVAPAHLELLWKSGILARIIGRSQFILIERNDKLAQAISHLIAFQTGKFMSTANVPESKNQPVFDRDTLNKIIATIINEYRDFNLFFARNGLIPVRIIYEQLVRHPVEVLSMACESIGFPDLQINPGNATLSKQADQLNAEWRRKYLEE